ncbi:MAG: hypothetical protein JKY98_09370 [Gammaproteobacteria bacterium]|nr:hypothetical protein [Gammaproteobacteria bacterium]
MIQDLKKKVQSLIGKETPVKILLALLVSTLFASTGFAQQIRISNQTWSAEVIRPSGQPVIPLFEGWFTNDDGTHSLCFGYLNLNTEQSLTVPTGEDNYLSDSRFKAMLPTHFDPLPPKYRRKFCVFTVTVPADFRRDETVEWHLTTAGDALSVPGHILPAYVLDEPVSNGRGDIAPLIKLNKGDAGVRGRIGIHNDMPIKGKVNTPLQLSAWIEHPEDEVWIGWAKHTGPGSVEFSEQEYQFPSSGDPTQVQATFSEPGRYIVRMQTIDDIASFEFICCHSNAYYTIDITN